jgi:hypothetical protein
MAFTMITPQHNYDNGYIGLVNIAREGLPDKIVVEGYELLKKREFHVSLMAVKHLAPMLKADNPKRACETLKQDFLDFAKTHDLRGFRLTGEHRLVKRDTRVTVVAMVDMPGISELFEALREKHNVAFPIQPTHITLYTLQPGAGIGLLSAEELQRDSTPAAIYRLDHNSISQEYPII